MSGLISEKFRQWEKVCEERYLRLKTNEEELNRYFIDEYGLSDELDPFVADKDVTIRKADINREIKSLISYAAGCIFGRYSLDCDGLCYAGGEWDDALYQTIIPVKEGIIPIGIGIFEDDLTSRIIGFVEKAYGSDTLEENMRFIASVLGYDLTPEKALEHYLKSEFFHDHCRIYHKRPIYWMFDSGRKCHFKALAYLHSITPQTTAILSEKYLPVYQRTLTEESDELKKSLLSAGPSEKPKMKRRITRIAEQMGELDDFSSRLSSHTNSRYRLELDDGVKVNYSIYSDVLEKIKP